MTSDRTVFVGRSVLPAGLDTARVRADLNGRPLPGLATVTDDGQMAVILDENELGAPACPAAMTLTVIDSQVRAPARTAENLLRLDIADTDADTRRWVCHAVLFALEAHDPAVRAARLDLMLTGGISG